MITALEIENFKCFSHLRLSFGALTLLTGFNGGGKSSAIQPLLLLAQSLRNSASPEAFALNGPLVHLGTVSDILPSESGNSSVRFKICGPSSDEAHWSLWTFSSRDRDRFLADGSKSKGIPEKDNAGASLGGSVRKSLANLIYLSAVREGTANSYPIPDSNNEILGDVGTDGRFAAYIYDQLVDDEVQELRRHPNEAATSLRKQLDAWIGTLFPGAQVNVRIIPQVSLLSLQFRLSDFGAWLRPANIGYGLSYAFPILVALLAAHPGQVVIIDSPEAHLHPSAQSQMGRILAHFAKAGVQIIVETHSDHLLNGARLAVKERILSHAELQIYFFTGAGKLGHGVISPTIDRDGGINEWPAGFFDQSEKDLSRLADWA